MGQSYTQRKIPFGFSLTRELVQRIDYEKGDISRSRFVLRLLERSLTDLHNQQKMLKNKRKKNAGSSVKLSAN
jgi:hypothetical protein